LNIFYGVWQHSYFVVEFITFTVEFILFAIELISFAVQFVTFAVVFAQEFITVILIAVKQPLSSLLP